MLKQHDKIHLEVANIKAPNLFNSKIYSLIESINKKFRKQLIGYIKQSPSNDDICFKADMYYKKTAKERFVRQAHWIK